MGIVILSAAIGAVAALAINFFRESLKAAIQRRAAASRVQAYIHAYWKEMAQDSASLKIASIGLAFSKKEKEAFRTGGAESLTKTIEEKGERIKNFKKHVEKEMAENEELIPILIKEIKNTPDETFNKIILALENRSSNIIDGKIFFGREEELWLPYAAQVKAIEAKTLMVDTLNEAALFIISIRHNKEPKNALFVQFQTSCLENMLTINKALADLENITSGIVAEKIIYSAFEL